MPRNKYPEETVQKILDASLKLFLEKGYEETTVLDIISEMGGLTRGAFYHHFKSKEEVFDALCEKLFYETNPFEKAKRHKELNGLEKLKIVFRQSYFPYAFSLHSSTISSSITGSPNLSVISLIIKNFSHVSSVVIGYIVGIDQKLVKRTNSSASNFACSVFIEPSFIPSSINS